MSKPNQNWKHIYRSGMFACPKLRQRKVHRDLLSYLVHVAHQSSRYCWPSQPNLARVCGCSVRNVHGLLEYLHGEGAIFPVKFVDLPKKLQDQVKELSPRKNFRNSNAYYLSVAWAEDVLAGEIQGEPVPVSVSSNLTREAQGKGRQKGNERRRRYAPIDVLVASEQASSALLDDWHFLGVVPAETGSPTSPLNGVETGSGATDIFIEYNQAANSTPKNGVGDSSIDHLQEQITTTTTPSSVSVPSPIPMLDENGAGKAGALGQGAKLLAGLGGAHGSAEYDAAPARAIDRRVS